MLWFSTSLKSVFGTELSQKLDCLGKSSESVQYFISDNWYINGGRTVRFYCCELLCRILLSKLPDIYSLIIMLTQDVKFSTLIHYSLKCLLDFQSFCKCRLRGTTPQGFSLTVPFGGPSDSTFMIMGVCTNLNILVCRRYFHHCISTNNF